MFIIYLFLAVLALHCCTGFSLVVASRSCSLVAMHRLLAAVASLAEDRLEDMQASAAGQHLGSLVSAPRL